MDYLGSLLALFALPLAALACGSLLLWAGSRGRRVGHHPTCRRCGFNLTGRPQGSYVCPECGSDLKQPRAVAVGDLVRKPVFLVAGVAAVVVGGFNLAGGVRRAVADDVNSLKPAWWLAREAHRGDRPHRQAALAELRHRVALGRVSDSTASRLTASALARQADLTTPWEAEWGEWVEAALAAGKLSDAERDRYFRQAVAGCYVGLKVRPRVRRGDPFYVTPVGEFDPRLAGQRGIRFVEWPVLRLDGKTVVCTTDRWGFQALIPPGVPLARPDLVPYDSLTDGRHTMVLSAKVWVSTKSNAPSAEVPVRVEAEWELVPTGAGSVELVEAPELREQIEPQVWAGVEADPVREGAHGRVLLTFNRLPLGVAYDVVLRAGQKEWPAGRVSAAAGTWAPRITDTHMLQGFDAGKVDVVLRPNPEAAEGTLDVLRVWNHEIVTRDVLVARRPPPRRVAGAAWNGAAGSRTPAQ
jgi:hypothetical protein